MNCITIKKIVIPSLDRKRICYFHPMALCFIITIHWWSIFPFNDEMLTKAKQQYHSSINDLSNELVFKPECGENETRILTRKAHIIVRHILK